MISSSLLLFLQLRLGCFQRHLQRTDLLQSHVNGLRKQTSRGLALRTLREVEAFYEQLALHLDWRVIWVLLLDQTQFMADFMEQVVQFAVLVFARLGWARFNI